MTDPRTLDEVLDAAFTSELEARGDEDLRARRDDAVALETEASYLRRVAQGRLDILEAELARRRGGGTGDGLGDLIAELPRILSGGGGRTEPVQSRMPHQMDPGESSRLSPRFALLLDDQSLLNLPVTDDAGLEAAIVEHREHERQLSQLRRQLFEVIDRLEAVLARRLAST